MMRPDEGTESEYLQSQDMHTRTLPDGSFVMFPNGERDELRALLAKVSTPSAKPYDRIAALARYEAAKAAKTGTMIECACCAKQFKKASHQQAFCSNKGRNNCKDVFWNRASPERTQRAKDASGQDWNSSCSSFAKSLDQAIKEITARIKKENPGCTDLKVYETPANDGKPLLIDELIKRLKEHRPDLQDDDIAKWEFLLLTNTGRKDCRETGYWLPIGPAARKEIEKGDYRDFVYFRRWGIFLFDVSKHTSHELFMANWNWILSNMLDDDTVTIDDMPSFDNSRDEAEKFLHNNHGLFLSSAYSTSAITKSTNMKLTASERLMFAGHRIREIDPDDN